MDDSGAKMSRSCHSFPPNATDDHLPCPNCGYDLFGIPEDRCPECGFRYTFAPLTAFASDCERVRCSAAGDIIKSTVAAALAVPLLLTQTGLSPPVQLVLVMSMNATACFLWFFLGNAYQGPLSIPNFLLLLAAFLWLAPISPLSMMTPESLLTGFIFLSMGWKSQIQLWAVERELASFQTSAWPTSSTRGQFVATFVLPVSTALFTASLVP